MAPRRAELHTHRPPPTSRLGSPMQLEGQGRQPTIPTLVGTLCVESRLSLSVECLPCGPFAFGSREKHGQISRGIFGSLTNLSDYTACSSSRFPHAWLEQMSLAGKHLFRVLRAF